MAQVTLEWRTIDFVASDTWKVMAAKLEEAGVDIGQLNRSVYVIRAKAFCIAYPREHSPVLYIGEGNLKSRLENHRTTWVSVMSGLLDNLELEAVVCCPRVRNNIAAHKALEAHLLNVFKGRFGSLPLRNKQNEFTHFDHFYERAHIDRVLGVGRGRRIHWAIAPRPSNPLHGVFLQGQTA